MPSTRTHRSVSKHIVLEHVKDDGDDDPDDNRQNQSSPGAVPDTSLELLGRREVMGMRLFDVVEQDADDERGLEGLAEENKERGDVEDAFGHGGVCCVLEGLAWCF